MENEIWGWFWWDDILQEEQKECSKCGCKRIRYDEDRAVWVCLNCDYEWEMEE